MCALHAVDVEARLPLLPIDYGGDVFVAPAQPLDVSQPTELTTRGADGPFVSGSLTYGIEAGISYSVRSMVRVDGALTASQLATAGTDYPSWVKPYLDVRPGSIGESVSADVADRQRAGKKFEPRSNLKNGPFQIYADHNFVDALYPWLEPSTAPANAQGFSTFLARPGVTEREIADAVRGVFEEAGATTLFAIVGAGGNGAFPHYATGDQPVAEGDAIVIDAKRKTIELGVSQETIDRRLRLWKPPPKKAERGLLAKYARLVSSASQGAVTDAALD